LLQAVLPFRASTLVEDIQQFAEVFFFFELSRACPGAGSKLTMEDFIGNSAEDGVRERTRI